MGRFVSRFSIQEAIQNKKVSRFGKYKVSRELYNIYDTVCQKSAIDYLKNNPAGKFNYDKDDIFIC